MSDRLANLLNQPEFIRPSRLPSLYSDFSPLARSNRDGYEANVNAWITALDQMTWREYELSITADSSLRESLASPQWGTPLAIAAVEREAVIRKKWIPLDQFMSMTESIYQSPSSRIPSLGAIVSWGWSNLFTSAPSKTMSGLGYVVVDNLERMARLVMDSVVADCGGAGYSARITTRALLHADLTKRLGHGISSSDLSLLLRFMERDTKQCRCVNETIKFSQASQITDSDIAISQLKSTMVQLTNQIEALAVRITDVDRALSVSLTKKERALGLLRTKKMLDTTVLQRQEMQLSVSTILMKLDDAVANVGVVEAMRAGGQALEQILSSIGGVDRVEDVLDQVRTQIEVGDDIGRVIAEQLPSDGQGEQDDEQVEAEYLELVKHQEKEQKQPQSSSSVEKVANDISRISLDEQNINDKAEPESRAESKAELKAESKAERQAVLA